MHVLSISFKYMQMCIYLQNLKVVGFIRGQSCCFKMGFKLDAKKLRSIRPFRFHLQVYTSVLYVVFYLFSPKESQKRLQQTIAFNKDLS